jgi:glycosyltransferase involved in cell wall biosynthesis
MKKGAGAVNIGFVTDSFYFDDGADRGFGGNTYTAQLYDGLRQAGVEITLWSYPITTRALSHSDRRLFNIGDRQPSAMWRRVLVTSRDLLRHKRELRECDIIHSTSGSSVAALSHIAAGSAKFVFDFRTPFSNVNRTLNLYKAALFFLFKPDWVLFVDPFSLERYRRLYGRTNCSYVPVSTDLIRFQPAQRTHRNTVRLLYSGVLRKDKGILDLLMAMEQVWKIRPDVELAIAGDGPLRSEIAKICAVDSRLTYLGLVANESMPEILNSADIFVLPSYREGFSRAIVEAMACGLPVITTDVGGMQSLKGTEVAAIVKPGNVAELVQAIMKYSVDPDLCKTAGELARKYVIAHHSQEQVISSLLELYSRLCP